MLSNGLDASLIPIAECRSSHYDILMDSKEESGREGTISSDLLVDK